MPSTFELAFLVHIASVAHAGVHQGGTQDELISVRQHYALGMDIDSRLARKAPWLVDLGHMSLQASAYGNHGLAVHYHWLHNPAGKRLAGFGHERSQGSLKFYFKRSSGRQRRVGLGYRRNR